MNMTTKTLIAGIAGLAMSAGSSSAATITILDDSFETPGGQFQNVPNWTYQTLSAAHASYGPGAFAGAGEYFAYNNDSEPPSDQSLTTAFAADTVYTFKGYIVDSGGTENIRFSIGYGGTGGSFTELAGVTYDPTNYSAWTEVAGVSYTTGVAGPEIGENIVVRIAGVDGGSGGVWFDNVSLDGSLVPEPGSLALMGLGGLCILRRRRK